MRRRSVGIISLFRHLYQQCQHVCCYTYYIILYYIILYYVDGYRLLNSCIAYYSRPCVFFYYEYAIGLFIMFLCINAIFSVSELSDPFSVLVYSSSIFHLPCHRFVVTLFIGCTSIATVCLISIYRGTTIGLYHCMALSFHWQYVVIYQLLLVYIIIVLSLKNKYTTPNKFVN